MTAAFLIVLSLTALAVLANFVAMLFALREVRRAHETLAKDIQAAYEGTDAVLAEVRHSNEITRRSLEAVERSLEYSKRAFEVAHQPSLHIVKVETISGNSSVDTMLAARVSLRNTGTSDAHDVVISGHFHIGGVNLDEIEFLGANGGSSQGFVAPDHVVHGTIQQSLTFELRDANARSGRLTLVCFVRHGDDYGATHHGVFIRAWTGGQWVAVREKRRRLDSATS